MDGFYCARTKDILNALCPSTEAPTLWYCIRKASQGDCADK